MLLNFCEAILKTLCLTAPLRSSAKWSNAAVRTSIAPGKKDHKSHTKVYLCRWILRMYVCVYECAFVLKLRFFKCCCLTGEHEAVKLRADFDG